MKEINDIMMVHGWITEKLPEDIVDIVPYETMAKMKGLCAQPQHLGNCVDITDKITNPYNYFTMNATEMNYEMMLSIARKIRFPLIVYGLQYKHLKNHFNSRFNLLKLKHEMLGMYVWGIGYNKAEDLNTLLKSSEWKRENLRHHPMCKLSPSDPHLLYGEHGEDVVSGETIFKTSIDKVDGFMDIYKEYPFKFGCLYSKYSTSKIGPVFSSANASLTNVKDSVLSDAVELNNITLNLSDIMVIGKNPSVGMELHSADMHSLKKIKSEGIAFKDFSTFYGMPSAKWVKC